MDVAHSLQAAKLIGKSVLVPGTKVSLGTDDQGNKQATGFGVDLMSASASTVVSVLDSSGALIRKIDLGPQPVGVLSLTWNGRDEAGAPVPAGAYHLSIQASDAKGQPVSAETLTSGTVGSVAYSSDGLQIGRASCRERGVPYR